jgi:hypothetical protein
MTEYIMKDRLNLHGFAAYWRETLSAYRYYCA